MKIEQRNGVWYWVEYPLKPVSLSALRELLGYVGPLPMEVADVQRAAYNAWVAYEQKHCLGVALF